MRGATPRWRAPRRRIVSGPPELRYTHGPLARHPASSRDHGGAQDGRLGLPLGLGADLRDDRAAIEDAYEVADAIQRGDTACGADSY